jgi:hypothetical protein
VKTPREEFEEEFGPITDDRWEWLKQFCLRNPVTGGPKPDAIAAYQAGIRAEQDWQAEKNWWVGNSEIDPLDYEEK